MCLVNVDKRTGRRSITIGERTFFLPYLHLLRPLHKRELDELRRSVGDFGGIVQPITVTKDNDVIDGYHRLSVLAELGIQYVPTTIVEVTPEAAENLAISLNACRRQLTVEELSNALEYRRNFVANKNRQGYSYPAIADMLKADPNIPAGVGVGVGAVQRDVEFARASGVDVDPPNGIKISRDGKRQAARHHHDNRPKNRRTPKITEAEWEYARRNLQLFQSGRMEPVHFATIAANILDKLVADHFGIEDSSAA